MTIDRFRATKDGIAFLLRKTVQEIRDPGQLLNPQRRAELISHGATFFDAIIHQEQKSIKANETDMEPPLIVEEDKNGLVFAYSGQARLGMIAFPQTAEIRYILSPTGNREINHGKFAVVGPTVEQIFGRYHYIPPTPSEGYREGLDDRSVTVVDFVRRDDASQIQHGGILVDNETGYLELLNYQELMTVADSELNKGQVLMQTNWYMDSDNQDIICSRQNMQIPQPYNAIGYFETENGRIYFSLNTFIKVAKMKKYIEDEDKRPSSGMRNLAAFANIMARKLGAYSWRLCGLEYYGGGTYDFREPYPSQNYFAIDY